MKYLKLKSKSVFLHPVTYLCRFVIHSRYDNVLLERNRNWKGVVINHYLSHIPHLITFNKQLCQSQSCMMKMTHQIE